MHGLVFTEEIAVQYKHTFGLQRLHRLNVLLLRRLFALSAGLSAAFGFLVVRLPHWSFSLSCLLLLC